LAPSTIESFEENKKAIGGNGEFMTRMQTPIEMNSYPKGKNKMTKYFLEKFPEVVVQVKKGEIKRYDSWCTFDGVAHDVSIYWMSADLVRVDFKTPKPKKRSLYRSAKGCHNPLKKQQSEIGGGNHPEPWDPSLVQGVTCD
jgi:hypothetical protein